MFVMSFPSLVYEAKMKTKICICSESSMPIRNNNSYLKIYPMYLPYSPHEDVVHCVSAPFLFFFLSSSSSPQRLIQFPLPCALADLAGLNMKKNLLPGEKIRGNYNNILVRRRYRATFVKCSRLWKFSIYF